MLKDGAPEYSLHAYENQFRAYLLGKSLFPRDASLFIYIRYRTNLTQLSHGVKASYGPTTTSYNFAIPELSFQMEVGKYRPFQFIVSSFNENTLRPIMDTAVPDELNDALLKKIIESHKKPRKYFICIGLDGHGQMLPMLLIRPTADVQLT